VECGASGLRQLPAAGDGPARLTAVDETPATADDGLVFVALLPGGTK
jgi:hypothetical protein